MTVMERLNVKRKPPDMERLTVKESLIHEETDSQRECNSQGETDLVEKLKVKERLTVRRHKKSRI